jgi:hypothetical protein
VTALVVGVDPGESCGIAVLRDGYRSVVGQNHPDDVILVLTQMMTHNAPLAVTMRIGIERFITTPETGRRSQQSTALEVIGAIEFEARRHGVPVHRQTVSDVKKFASNRLLRELNLYVTPAEVDRPDANDANDAMRHAVYCVARHHATIFAAMQRRGRLLR